MTSQFSYMVFSKNFWRFRDSLVKFNYFSKFLVNLMVGFGFMAFSVYKGLIRNLEIRKTLVRVLLNIWRLERVRIPHLARMSLIKCYWMLQNTSLTAFTVFELLMENQQGSKLCRPLTLGLNSDLMFLVFQIITKEYFSFVKPSNFLMTLNA